jgi:hypothetical protein
VSFLDNLENDLKALEGRETGGLEDARRGAGERERAIAAAPWAEKLKNCAFTKELMDLATRAGYPRRIKVHLMWIETTLRLEAGGQRLELRPQKDGVALVFLDGPDEVEREVTDLSCDAKALVERWMVRVDAWRKREEELAAAAEPIED